MREAGRTGPGLGAVDDRSRPRRGGGLRAAPERRAVGDRPIGLEDQREGAVAALVEAVLEQVEAALGVGARDAEAVGQQLADVGGAEPPRTNSTSQAAMTFLRLLMTRRVQDSIQVLLGSIQLTRPAAAGF